MTALRGLWARRAAQRFDGVKAVLQHDGAVAVAAEAHVCKPSRKDGCMKHANPSGFRVYVKAVARAAASLRCVIGTYTMVSYHGQWGHPFGRQQCACNAHVCRTQGYLTPVV